MMLANQMTEMDLSTKDSQGYRGNHIFRFLRGWDRLHDDDRKELALNVLLLGDKQSGRSSVGNALIGGQEFPTGVCVSSVSMTTECRLLSRRFRSFFRRKGAETDLTLRVMDTPPLPRLLGKSVCDLCPEGVHVLALVVRADLPYENTQLEECAQTLFGSEWRQHSILVLTHTDHLGEAGLQSSHCLTQATDSLRALADTVGGGVSFLDNSSDWPAIRGRPLRDALLRLSARNHHSALRVQTGS